MNKPGSSWFSTSQLATASGLYRKAVARRAAREGWPRRPRGNRTEFLVRGELREQCAALFSESVPPVHPDRLFRDCRRATGVFAVLLLLRRRPALSQERAIHQVAGMLRVPLQASATALRRWLALAQSGGISALADRRAGRSGRKPKAKHV